MSLRPARPSTSGLAHDDVVIAAIASCTNTSNLAVMLARSVVAAEPAPTKAECIATSESGQDLRHAGKHRDARAHFSVCVADSCPGPVREDCAQRLHEIRKAMPTVVFEVTDSDGNDVPSMVITGRFVIR